jgi:hypothetical protein
LIFQFTVLNGDIIVYGSRTEQYPNQNNCDLVAPYNMDQIVFKSESYASPLKGDFWLAVEASSVTQYTLVLLVQTIMVDVPVVNFSPTYTGLSDGIPQLMSVTGKTPEYFAFKVQQTNLNSPIYISLES